MASAAPKTQLNLVSPENLLNPFPLYKELRENDPVHWSEEVHAWILTRHDDVLNGFRDPRLSAERSRLFVQTLQMAGIDLEDARDVLEVTRQHMANRDGPEHIRLRRSAGPGFSPQVVDSWQPSIRRIMNYLVDQVQAKGRMDLVPAVSYVMPPLVIAEVLGVPPEDREHFQKLSVPLGDFTSMTPLMDMGKVTRDANAAIKEMSQYLSAKIAERRVTPGHDVLSLLIHNQETGRMSEAELVANSIIILLAGHLTTTDQISNGLHLLLTHPQQLRALQQDLGLLKPAVEEMLRFNPAVPFMHRIAVDDIPLRGRTIKKGDMVFLGLAAANRDPQLYENPDVFDITRDNITRKHMSFAFGPHHCLGAGLARREMEIAFEVLLERLPGLRLDEEQPPRIKCMSLTFRGFESLPVRW